ncbi:MAG: FAD-binding protein, partial [Pseudomonadota bacterium]
PRAISWLRDLGVAFDTDGDGDLALSREAAHSRRRVVRSGGDRSGAAVMDVLQRQARGESHILVLENTRALDLQTDTDGQITGVTIALGTPASPKLMVLRCAGVVLATGGVGQLYQVTTNPAGSYGAGLAMGARAGALVRDPEFIQFHPTTIDAGIDPAPLASEALRGEGATLVNASGEPFMKRYDQRGDLAPRDVVARAVDLEIKSGRGAFLDARTAIGDAFPTAFPTVYAGCIDAGIDPVTELVPMAPGAHYHMGGLLTDLRGRTTVPRLWAVGEVASTGVHGANRLASNSLMEALVFARAAADDVIGALGTDAGGQAVQSAAGGNAPSMAALQVPAADIAADQDRARALSPAEAERFDELRELIANSLGVVRNAEDIAGFLAWLEQLAADHDGEMPAPLSDAVLVARIIAVAAAARMENRGAHFRADVPSNEGSNTATAMNEAAGPHHSIIAYGANAQRGARALNRDDAAGEMPAESGPSIAAQAQLVRLSRLGVGEPDPAWFDWAPSAAADTSRSVNGAGKTVGRSAGAPGAASPSGRDHARAVGIGGGATPASATQRAASKA